MRQFCRKGSSAVIGSILMLIGIAACGNLAAPAPPLGHLQVFVTDSATNVGVGTLPMSLWVGSFTTGTEWAELRTSTDGTGEFRPGDGGVIIQPYVVHLDLSASTYTLAASETNNKPVTVLVGQTVTVTFKLHKVVAAGGGGGG
jgi:hypothetical protein